MSTPLASSLRPSPAVCGAVLRKVKGPSERAHIHPARAGSYGRSASTPSDKCRFVLSVDLSESPPHLSISSRCTMLEPNPMVLRPLLQPRVELGVLLRPGLPSHDG